jgi:flagellar basal body-associated protein FliL
MKASDWINLAIAVFTAIAAAAALVSAISSARSSKAASKAAEESKKIAVEQAQALLTAAKANALDTRISFYTQQMQRLPPLRDRRRRSSTNCNENKNTLLDGWTSKLMLSALD